MIKTSPRLFLAFGKTTGTHQPVKWLQCAAERAKTFKGCCVLTGYDTALACAKGGGRGSCLGSVSCLPSHHRNIFPGPVITPVEYLPGGNQMVCSASVRTHLLASLGQDSPALQPQDWVSTCSISFGAKYRGGRAAYHVGESSWSSGEEGRSGMGHLHEKFFLEAGVFVKKHRKEGLLCGCQKAEGGCCKCLNSHAKHIQLCCPSNDPNQDRQTVRSDRQ